MDLQAELLALERDFWTGDADFYRQHLDERCLTVFAGFAAVMDKERVAATVGEPDRWRDVEMRPIGCFEPCEGVALLTYEAHARRPGGEPHAALVTSGYVRRGAEWKLAFHQQTPLGGAAQVAEPGPLGRDRAEPRPASLYEVYGIEPAGIGTHLGIDEPRPRAREAAH